MSSNYDKTFTAKKATAIEFHKLIVESQLLPSCMNCTWWCTQNNGCSLYKAVPPPQIIVWGCEKHEYEIPF